MQQKNSSGTDCDKTKYYLCLDYDDCPLRYSNPLGIALVMGFMAFVAIMFSLVIAGVL